MKIVSENQFSGKTYFYTIGPWMEAKVGFSRLKIMVGPAQNATQNCMPNWAAMLNKAANAKFCIQENRKMRKKQENLY